MFPRARAGERMGTRGCNSMVEYLPSKQATWVRFPSPALGWGGAWRALGRVGNEIQGSVHSLSAAVAQLVERVLGKDEVLGSNPSGSFHGSIGKDTTQGGHAIGLGGRLKAVE